MPSGVKVRQFKQLLAKSTVIYPVQERFVSITVDGEIWNPFGRTLEAVSEFSCCRENSKGTSTYPSLCYKYVGSSS